MRNLEKGQHIFIAFQDGKSVLDSQLRPRIYTSLENADKWTPTVNKGKIEYVEYAPTLTPPNEWVSVEDAMPPELKMVLVYCGGLYDVAGWVKDEEDKICWTCKTEPEFWRPIPELDG